MSDSDSFAGLTDQLHRDKGVMVKVNRSGAPLPFHGTYSVFAMLRILLRSGAVRGRRDRKGSCRPRIFKEKRGGVSNTSLSSSGKENSGRGVRGMSGRGVRRVIIGVVARGRGGSERAKLNRIKDQLIGMCPSFSIQHCNCDLLSGFLRALPGLGLVRRKAGISIALCRSGDGGSVLRRCVVQRVRVAKSRKVSLKALKGQVHVRFNSFGMQSCKCSRFGRCVRDFPGMRLVRSKRHAHTICIRSWG